MERLNFNKLYYFYVVAKEGSIKAASKMLHLTQPTISAQIRQLEEEIGFEVFVRKHRKLELNENGSFLLKKAEKLFIMADEVVSSLPRRGNAPRVNIRIGAIQSLSNSFIYDFSLKAWNDKTLIVTFVQGSMDELIEKMDRDNIHLILSDNPYERSKKYISTNLGNDKIVAVASPKLKYLKNNFPFSLDEKPYIAFSNQGRLQEDVNYFFDRENIHPELVGEVDDVTLMRVITESSESFAVLPFRAVKESIKLGKLVMLGSLEQVKSTLWVITPSMARNRVLLKKIINDYLIRQR